MPADLHREVVRLLVQVAWADSEVAESEREHILGIARAAKLDEAEISDIEKALATGGKLPAPDMGLLRQYPQDVIHATRVLIARDGQVSKDEADMIERISELLAPRDP